MEIYKNLSGRETIEGYEIGEDFIVVKFTDPSNSGFHTYKYTEQSAGEENIERMKERAEEGDGLSDFIRMNVRKLYESRE
ncbi:MAG: hypothetical protein AAB660_00645 [Patescibacteria group bacterium]